MPVHLRIINLRGWVHIHPLESKENISKMNKKHSYKIIMTALAACLLTSAFFSEGAPLPPTSGYNSFATVGTAGGTTNSAAIISALSVNASLAPTVTFLSVNFVGADTNGGVLQFYTCTNVTQCTASNTTLL